MTDVKAGVEYKINVDGMLMAILSCWTVKNSDF